jgi:hypothetical protein
MANKIGVPISASAECTSRTVVLPVFSAYLLPILYFDHLLLLFSSHCFNQKWFYSLGKRSTQENTIRKCE